MSVEENPIAVDDEMLAGRLGSDWDGNADAAGRSRLPQRADPKMVA
jgi:hypothetical protein